MLMKIGAASRRRIEFKVLTEAEEREQLMAFGEPPGMIDAHLSIYRAIRVGRLSYVTETIRKVLGRPARPFEEWVQDNLSVFN